MSTTRARRASGSEAAAGAGAGTEANEGFSRIHQKPSARSLTRIMQAFIFAVA
jgi:hypothetical protein